MIIAFNKAKMFGSTIDLSSYTEPTEGIGVIEDLLGIRVPQIISRSVKELRRQVIKTFNKG